MGKMIELTASDDHRLAAYQAEPTGQARGGIVVIQEIFGVNSHIKAVSDGFAADGVQTGDVIRRDPITRSRAREPRARPASGPRHRPCRGRW